ncbi:type VII secretion protein EccCa [Mycobacterium hubeiense]|uniref:type VII secretion protein EccCa n=1 Tax=Mycobacterium hubeiense TaxID=1867256 RepID=UPI000C7EB7FF|nr:type VII secretion protein EccCa [Mycobacterium sp. QGD 101]
MDFIRQTRIAAPDLPVGELAVAAPPELPRAAPANPLARLLPIAMLVAAAGMMALYLSSGATMARSPMFLFFPVMMLVSALGTVAFGARGTNRTAEINQARREYLVYLDGLTAAVNAAAECQHRSLHFSHPDPAALWTLAGGPRMWERVPTDANFGLVRIGTGTQPLSMRLLAPDQEPAAECDPVTSTALQRLLDAGSAVPGLPITVMLRDAGVVTIDGEASQARAVLRAIICQLAMLHSPEHLKIAAVVSISAGGEWDWLKWLPHHQHPHAVDAAGPVRLTYRSLQEARLDDSVWTVVVVDGSVVTDVDPGVTVLKVGSPLSGVTVRTDAGAQHVAAPDGLTRGQALACARRLARFEPAMTSVGSGVSTDWPELMGIGDLGRIEPARLWRLRDERRRLKVPIGVAEDGTPVELDLKEAAQQGVGPHGLCVGATGSGKSEFLRTLTLGLVATHSPEELNLVLVDFKGGATFLGLERAAHVSAVITNLADEAHLVARMKDAIAGEMNRRQELLRAAGNLAHIADYRTARARGAALAALPALLIVVDEFSELLHQHPDFAELFLAVGRVGRSLGMHLLLASQRLDEGRLRGLETHLSYRICLKTFSPTESRAVLGVPCAYDLPNEPGAAYLKTASGELIRFQTAFVSKQYGHRASTPSTVNSTSAQRFTAAAVGHVSPPPADRQAVVDRTVLDAALDRLSGHGTPAHQVWLPPLAESPTVDALLAQPNTVAPLSVPVGIIDRPFDQRREPLVVALAGPGGNVAVVGGPGSGKSTALRTLVTALAATHDPRDVQIYCLDFGGGALSSLRPLPHVGSVAGRADADLVRRTVAELETIVRSREARFRQQGIDSVAEYRRRRAADDEFGDVFLVIDGWATLRQEFDGLETAITSLAAQGLSYGVHIVIAASRWAEIRPALKDQIGTRIELRLGDPAESEMDRKRARLLADAPPGRGITRDGHEFAIALPRLDGRSTTVGLADALTACGHALQTRYQGRRAPRVELLPTQVHIQAIATAAGSPTQLTLGIGERELRPIAVDFAEQHSMIVLGEGQCGKTTVLRTLCRELVRTNDPAAAQLLIVDYRRTLLGVVETEHVIGYAISAIALESQLPRLLDRLRSRLPGEDVTQQQLRTRSWWSGPEIYVLVDDYDLVAGVTGNPLTPLLDYLPHAKDVGLHLVVARRSGGAARAMFDPILARMRDLGCMGLLMSTSPEEGVLLGSVRPSILPPGRGTLIARAQPEQLVQVAWSDPP